MTSKIWRTAQPTTAISCAIDFTLLFLQSRFFTLSSLLFFRRFSHSVTLLLSVIFCGGGGWSPCGQGSALAWGSPWGFQAVSKHQQEPTSQPGKRRPDEKCTLSARATYFLGTVFYFLPCRSASLPPLSFRIGSRSNALQPNCVPSKAPPNASSAPTEGWVRRQDVSETERSCLWTSTIWCDRHLFFALSAFSCTAGVFSNCCTT